MPDPDSSERSPLTEPEGKETSPYSYPAPITPKQHPIPAHQHPLGMKVLSIDIGGTHVKILLSGEKEPRKMVSGSTFTPAQLVKDVTLLAKGWNCLLYTSDAADE